MNPYDCGKRIISNSVVLRARIEDLEDQIKKFDNSYAINKQHCKRIELLEAINQGLVEARREDRENPPWERIEELETNCGFFKSCALSGEVPKDGSEPYPPEKE